MGRMSGSNINLEICGVELWACKIARTLFLSTVSLIHNAKPWLIRLVSIVQISVVAGFAAKVWWDVRMSPVRAIIVESRICDYLPLLPIGERGLLLSPRKYQAS